MDTGFKFSCHGGLDCFGDCCREADVFLTPYDVLCMKNALGISSGEFLKKYTGMLLDETGPPVIFLEMKGDEKKSCHFLEEKSCKIYEARPRLCRVFPLRPAAGGNYVITDRPGCMGLNEEREWTLEDWKGEEGFDVYDEMNVAFNEIIENKKLIKENMQAPNVLQMFFWVYDLDKFKRFVFESKFLDVFDVSREEINEMKESEVELLKFAIKWLKFGLIDKEALKIKDSVLKDQK
ncbi:MAG: YkgJ family cysteine cluster protein [Candidatus Hydrothermarchaeaceae archaeon]